MKESYFIKSDRYDNVHTFKRNGLTGNQYSFIPQEDWMPLYVTYNYDKSIKMVDTDGGPCLYSGWHNDEIEIVSIDEKGNFILREYEQK